MLMLLVLSLWVGGSTQLSTGPIALPVSSSFIAKDLTCSLQEDCPAGLFCSEHQCKCVHFKQILKCGEDSSLLVLRGYCLTYEEQKDVLMMGGCIFSSVRKRAYYAPYDWVQPGELNETCAQWNRAGVLCGRCLPNHYPLAYSYNLACVPCTHPHWNWLWYIMAAYLPLTLFYFFILFFKVKIMSGHMYCAISVFQALSCSALARVSYPYLNRNSETIFANVIFSLYGIWNLDFFRPYYSNLSLCLGVLPTLALDYVVAVYPLLLMVVSYLLITLYDRNYRVVTAMWSPFQRLFSLLRRKWDIKTSVIDSFATFFFLSNIKLFNVSFDLLVPNKVYHLLTGSSHISSWGLQYSADVEFLGKEHLPYGVLALTVSIFFVLVPIVLLTLYPFKFFQRFLNLFPFRWYILHTFMDSFLGCYKDGTQPGTRDCRWFLGVFLLVRILIFIAFNVHDGAYPLTVLILIAFSLAVLAVKPFRTPPTNSNVVCAAYTLLLAFIFSTFVAYHLSTFLSLDFISFFFVLGFLASIVPLVDGARVLLILVVRRRRGIYRCVMVCCRRCGPSDWYEELPGACAEGEELPSGRSLDPEASPKGNLSSFAAI